MPPTIIVTVGMPLLPLPEAEPPAADADVLLPPDEQAATTSVVAAAAASAASEPFLMPILGMVLTPR